MSDESPPTKPTTPVKAKNPMPKPTHPKYSVMIVAALNALKERRGSSRQAILKHIIAKYKVKENSVGVRLKLALRKGVENGSLQQMKGSGAAGSFKLVKNNSDSDAPKQRGRPKGSKNIKKAGKPAVAKKVHAKKSGRPAASKKVAKKTSTAKKTTGKPGRPTGGKKLSKKPTSANKITAKKSGRPKDSKNKDKK